MKARPRQVWAYVNRKQNSKFRQILRQSPWTQTRCLWITYRSPVFWEAAAYKLSWIWVWWLLCVDYCTHACEYRTNAGIRKILADSGSSVFGIWLAWTAKWSRVGGQVGVRSFGKCTGYRQVLFLQSSECVKRGYLRKSASADPALTLKLVQFCVKKSHDQKGKKRNWTEGVTQGHLTTRAEDLYRCICNSIQPDATNWREAADRQTLWCRTRTAFHVREDVLCTTLSNRGQFHFCGFSHQNYFCVPVSLWFWPREQTALPPMCETLLSLDGYPVLYDFNLVMRLT